MKKACVLWILVLALVLLGAQLRKENSRVTSFQINNGADSTFSRSVTLNNTVSPGMPAIRQGPDGYRADERNDFAHYPDWKAYGSAPSYNIWTAGEGVKTIYFQVKWGNVYSTVVSDTITLKRLGEMGTLPGLQTFLADPRVESASISITRTTAWKEGTANKYSFDVSYEFQVADVPDADKLSVDVLAVPNINPTFYPTPAGGWTPSATRHYRYTEGTRTGSSIRHGGSLTVVMDRLYSSYQSSINLEWLGEYIKFVINVPPDWPRRDTNHGNNEMSKEIRFTVRSEKSNKNTCECQFLFGTSGDWTFSVATASPFSWIAGSILRLDKCGDTGFSETEVKCDRLPVVPGQGERLVRFTRRPSNQDRSGSVFWKCEGLGNEEPGNVATTGGGPCPGALFKWEVETFFIEAAVL